MEVIFILLGAALLVAGGFLVAFIFTVRSGQYDDLYTPSVRMLQDDRERFRVNSDHTGPGMEN
jgi:cbb3-type cytochrome oxidase maturation protein